MRAAYNTVRGGSFFFSISHDLILRLSCKFGHDSHQRPDEDIDSFYRRVICDHLDPHLCPFHDLTQVEVCCCTCNSILAQDLRAALTRLGVLAFVSGLRLGVA